MFQTKGTSEHTFCFQQMFSEICAVYEFMWEKYSGAREAMGDNIIQRRNGAP